MKASRVWAVIFIVFLSILVLTEAFVIIASSVKPGSTGVETDWSGYSEMYRILRDEGYEVTPLLTSPTLLLEEDPEDTLFLSMGFNRPYSLTEVQAVRKYHSRGGTSIMADDTGNLNSLSQYYDVSINEGQVYDENYLVSPDFVTIDVSNINFFSGTIVMNRPASLSSGRGLILLNTTISGWVDRNGNGIRDSENMSIGEANGMKRLGVMTDPDFTTTGGGNIIFLSDPSMFINEMIGIADNREFLLSLVSYLIPEGGRIIIDESIHALSGMLGPVQTATRGLVVLTTDVNLKIIVGAIGTITILSALYVFEPPTRPKHVTFLDRTGLAELVDPGIGGVDRDEMRSVLLEKVRISRGMSTDQFSKLSWEELDAMIHNPRLSDFVRRNRKISKERLESILVEVEEWK